MRREEQKIEVESQQRGYGSWEGAVEPKYGPGRKRHTKAQKRLKL